MEAVQLDLFEFAAIQAAIQPKVQESPRPVRPRNFQNDGLHPMPTTPAARIEANFKAIRLLKELGARTPSHEEQITLSQFSGWGGLTEVFMEDTQRAAFRRGVSDGAELHSRQLLHARIHHRLHVGHRARRTRSQIRESRRTGGGNREFHRIRAGSERLCVHRSRDRSDFRKHRENALSASRRPDRFARKCQTSGTVRPCDRKRSIREIRPV